MRLRGALGLLALLLLGAGVFASASPFTDECLAQGASSGDVEPRVDCGGDGPPPPPVACTPNSRLTPVSALPRGRGLRLGFRRRGAGPVTVDVFRTSRGRKVLGTQRVARFPRRARGFAWNGRRAPAGIYFVRFRARGAETRRIALRRRDGRFSRRPAFERKSRCTTIRAFKLEGPVFGGTFNRPLGISYRLLRAGRVTVIVTRRGRVVRRLVRGRTDRAGRTIRLRLRSEGLRRGDHQVRIEVRPVAGGPAARSRLTAARL